MNIKEALIFELNHNFKVSETIKNEVISIASLELDMSDNAIGSNIDFYELVDEYIYEITTNKAV